MEQLVTSKGVPNSSVERVIQVVGKEELKPLMKLSQVAMFGTVTVVCHILRFSGV